MARITRQSRHLPLVAASMAALMVSAAAGWAQTPIEPHNNRYSPEQDVQLGREAVAAIRKQMPMLNDERTEDFVERIGERLIGEIPEQFRQPAFRYSFDVVNMKEINAFALPGGPMFVNRGMIEAARTEGEVAGVMAHELAHVILRHGTAQATKGQKYQIGAMVGQVVGSIIGGRTGAVVAQGSELGAGLKLMSYSREYESEADLFGAQLMARAGYDPKQMATMFETIAKQGGSRGIEWFSSHPNPENRAQAINREAAMLQIDGSAGKGGDLQSIHARLEAMPAAPTAEQVARGQVRRAPAGSSSAARGRVAPPSTQWRTQQPGDFLRLSVPANWQAIDAGQSVRYAPAGGFVQAPTGESAFTHGIEVGVASGAEGSLQEQTERLLQGFARANPELRREGGYTRTTIGGRTGLSTTLRNVSEVSGQETVNVSTVQLSDGSVLFLVGVAPAAEATTYLQTFARIRQSIKLADGR
jgi:Zn-dependent protease with chaperone function